MSVRKMNTVTGFQVNTHEITLRRDNSSNNDSVTLLEAHSSLWLFGSRQLGKSIVSDPIIYTYPCACHRRTALMILYVA